MDRGVLNRKSSLDLLEDLDMGFLNVGPLGKLKEEAHLGKEVGVKLVGLFCYFPVQQFDLDEIPFEASFGDDGHSRNALQCECCVAGKLKLIFLPCSCPTATRSQDAGASHASAHAFSFTRRLPSSHSLFGSIYIS